MPTLPSKSKSAGHVVKIEVPITWSVILVLVVVAFTLLYALWEEARSTIRFVGAATGVAAGVLSAIYVGRGLQITIEQRDQALTDEKIHKAFGFVQRWNDPNFATLRAEWRKVLAELDKQTDEKIWEIVSSDAHYRTVVADVLNFFEEMAYGAKSGVADADTLKKLCGSVIERYFSTVRPWIERRRNEMHHPTLYEHLEWLRNLWKSS